MSGRIGSRTRVAITLVSSELKFVYLPVTVAEAFDRGEARSYDWRPSWPPPAPSGTPQGS